MFVACLSVFITQFLFKKNIKITLPDSVPPNVSAPFEQLIPLVINVIVFYLLNVLCLKATGVIIPDFILNVFKPLLSASDTLPAMLIYVFLLNALWVIGVNGGNIVNSVMSSVLLMNLAENAGCARIGRKKRIFSVIRLI
ncbi:MAG: PTS transporter subunit EIIC [Holdemania massiliensis]